MEAAGGGHTTEPTDNPHFLYLPGSLPQSARRPVPPHRLVATLPQPSCIYFISIVCDRPNAASGLRRVQALGELARAWFVHILRASSIARFRATEPARSSKSKSPDFDSVTLLSHALAHKDLTPIVLANALALLVVLV